MAKLIVRFPDARTREYELKDRNTIGRHPEQSIQILDRLVSKEHIIITREPDHWALHDLGSLNGTLVNDERIRGVNKLNHKDRVAIGSTRMLFIDEAAAEGRHKVTIGDGLESSICNAIAQQTAEEFLPVDQVKDIESLKMDYEKLRIAAKLQHEIADELRMERLLPRLLDQLFSLFQADRGLVLLADTPGGPLVPRAVKVRGRRKDSEPIALSRTILRKVLSERTAVLTNDAQEDARFSHAQSIIIQGIRSSMCVPLLARDKRVLGVIHLDSQLATNAFTEKDLSMLQGIAQQASICIENSRLVARIEQEALTRQKFEKMLSPNLVERVLSGELQISKGGNLRTVTVMFTDIRGFTSLSEKTEAEDLIRLINEYFEILVDVIFEYEGTVDKFIGDAVMAVWSAPVEVQEAERKTLEAAVKMQKAMEVFNHVRSMDGLAPINTGIGVASGEVVAGYVGSTKTMSYTVIGDCVNLASRLCGVAGAGEICVTRETFHAHGGAEIFRGTEMEPIKLKGISEPVTYWSVEGLLDEDDDSTLLAGEDMTSTNPG
jgi:adenylate cyclase